MDFENSFSIAAPLDQVWPFLVDVPSVVPCVPGAELTETVSEREFKGTVRVKLGAVQLNYRGTVNVTQIDESQRKIVLTARASEARGGGSVNGTFTSTLKSSSAEVTEVRVVSDVVIAGRVTGFGRGIMQDVANRIIRDFSACLESKIRLGTGNQAAGEAPNPSPPGGQAAGQTTPGGGATPSAEVKVLPLLVDVGRERAARGLRAIARLLDSEEKD